MHNKALLIFAKQPVPGQVKTRLVPYLTATEASELFDAMIADTVHVAGQVPETDRMLFYSGDDQCGNYFRNSFPELPLFRQEGEDLGARMERALETVFRAGYMAAVVIGTDAPHLPPAVVTEAFRLLEHGAAEAVFGPAKDGGYYLIGMKRVHAELFRGVSWGTGDVFRQTMAKAERLGLKSEKLPVWNDIDTVDDLASLREPGSSAPLTRKCLKRLEGKEI